MTVYTQTLRQDPLINYSPVVSKVDLLQLIPEFNFEEFMQKAPLLNYDASAFSDEEFAEQGDTSHSPSATQDKTLSAAQNYINDTDTSEKPLKINGVEKKGAPEELDNDEKKPQDDSEGDDEPKKLPCPFVILEFRDTKYPVFGRFESDSCGSLPLLFSFEEQWELATMLFEGSVAEFIKELKESFQIENDIQLNMPQILLLFPENVSFADTCTLAELYSLHVAHCSSLKTEFSPLRIVISEQPVCFSKQLHHLQQILHESDALKSYGLHSSVVEIADEPSLHDGAAIELEETDGVSSPKPKEVVFIDDDSPRAESRPSTPPIESVQGIALVDEAGKTVPDETEADEVAEALEQAVNDTIEDAVFQVFEADTLEAFDDNDEEYEDDFLEDEEFEHEDVDPIESLGKIETFDSQELHNDSAIDNSKKRKNDFATLSPEPFKKAKQPESATTAP